MQETKSALLIVEDDITSQQYYSVILKDLYNIIMVPDVRQARDELNSHYFSLVIVDISLPGQEDGISLIKSLRSTSPEHPPIIVITAHAFPQNREEALSAGALAFYTKPILGNALIDAIETHSRKL